MGDDRGQDLGALVSVLTFNRRHGSPSMLAVLLVGTVVPALACDASTLRPDAGSGSAAGSGGAGGNAARGKAGSGSTAGSGGAGAGAGGAAGGAGSAENGHTDAAAPADAHDASGACRGDADCPCTKDSDCGAGSACGYRIADGCSAVLSCQTAPDPGNDVPIYYCGCDTTPVLTTLGYTYTFKPVSGFANDQSFPNCSTDAGARD